MESVNSGLKDTVVLESAVSELRLQGDNLIYRGQSIYDLVEHRSFDEAAFLLLTEVFPTLEQREHCQYLLEVGSVLSLEAKRYLDAFATNMPLSDFMMAASSMIERSWEEKRVELSASHSWEKGFYFLVQYQTIVAEAIRLQNGFPPFGEADDQSLSSSFLGRSLGRRPSSEEVKAFDRVRILYMEHGLNAATFAARIAASTQARLSAVFTTALSTLTGKLHGGAIEEVMAHFQAESIEELLARTQNQLDAGKRIMGFGHRIYRGKVDPRFPLMKKVLQSISLREDLFLSRIEALEFLLGKKKGIYPNLDLAGGPCFVRFGFRKDQFVGLISISRCVGWLAHYFEQIKDKRIIRPQAKYIGKKYSVETL